MPDARAGADHLHVARLGAAAVAEAVLVGDRAFADIGHDLHVGVRMQRKAAARRDLVVVPDPQRAPVDAVGAVIVRKGEVVPRPQPTMVGLAQTLEGAAFDHFGLPAEVPLAEA